MKKKIGMRKKTLRTIIAIVFITTLFACATIVRERYLKVPINTLPTTATVTVTETGEKVTTPGVLTFDNKNLAEKYTINIEKEGYKPASITLHRSMDGWLWGDIVFGGIIGLIVDFATGYAYDLDPEKIEQTLTPEGKVLLENKRGEELTIVLLDYESLTQNQKKHINTSGSKHPLY